MIGMLCRLCREPLDERQTNNRCSRCARITEVRSDRVWAKRLVAAQDHITDAGLPTIPTAALPGSPEKVAVLIERAAARRSLWHPDDGLPSVPVAFEEHQLPQIAESALAASSQATY